MKLLKILTAISALALAGSAHAAVVYQFNATDVGAFGAGPYGTVTLVESGTGVDFTINLRADMNFVNTGGPHSVFSFNALDVLASDISNILFNGVSGASLGFTVVSPGGNSPFGSTFSLAVDCTVTSICSNGGPGQTADPLLFTVANSSYADFGFLAQGTTAFFAADVISAGATGAIGVTTGPNPPPPPPQGSLPEPGSLALVSMALLGLGYAGKRRRHS